MDAILLGHGLLDDLGEGVVSGISGEGVLLVDGFRLRVKPDAEGRVTTEEDELSDRVLAAGFEDVESAFDADVEEGVGVFLRCGHLHDDVSPLNDLINGLGIRDATGNRFG